MAYRAFFALPESISTSDGRPTNAIFGFASMLVKILTDFGQVPTVVVWDAGMSGRKEISADYKAQRSTRPDLLKLQWPHLQAARRGVRLPEHLRRGLRGRRRDRRARRAGQGARHPGDGRHRRPRRLPARRRRRADHVHVARRHRHEGLRPRGRDRALRHPARADPGLHRPQGRHQRQHPRRPRDRRQDRRRPAAAVRRPRRRAEQRRPDLRRQAQAEPDRARRQRAHVEAARDDGARHPDRPRSRGRVHAHAGPDEPEDGLPRLGAEGPAQATRRGARGRGARGDPAPRGRRHDRGQDRLRPLARTTSPDFRAST